MSRKNIRHLQAAGGNQDQRRAELDAMDWNELQKLAGRLQVLHIGMGRDEVVAAVLEHEGAA